MVELERCEESQRAQVKCHDRWHGLLKQKTGVQEGSISTQADDEVYAILKRRLNQLLELIHSFQRQELYNG